METNARYVQIGVFLLAIASAVFGFIYWLYNTGGIGKRDVYRVRFESPVPGLLVGSAVTFNGLRVGEVINLELNASKPEQVLAILAVDATTPVHADTEVDIDFQGFTGSPAVSLAGGTVSSGKPETANGQPPLLVAVPEAGEDLTHSTQSVLRRVDAILKENADPLREGIADLGTFANSLSRNSDRVDNILAGLERMTGAGTGNAKTRIYDLTVPASFARVGVIPRVQLTIPEPVALNVLNSNRVSVREPSSRFTALPGVRWADTLTVLLQSKINRSFENARFQGSLTQQAAGLDGDYQLVIDVRKFQLEQSQNPAAHIVLSAKLLARDGRIVGARLFQEKVPTTTQTEKVVAAIDQAFGSVMTDLVPWALEVMSRQPAGQTRNQ